MAARRSPPPLTSSIADPAIEWSADEPKTRPGSVELEAEEIADAYRMMTVMDRAWFLAMVRLSQSNWQRKFPKR
jgi:hypothetical protein